MASFNIALHEPYSVADLEWNFLKYFEIILIYLYMFDGCLELQ